MTSSKIIVRPRANFISKSTTCSLCYACMILLSAAWISSTVDASSFASRHATPIYAKPYHYGTSPSARTTTRRSLNSHPLASRTSNKIPSFADATFGQRSTSAALVNKTHKKQQRQFKKSSPSSTTSVNRLIRPKKPTNDNALASLWYFVRVGFAGGIAGAVGSFVLYPMDAAKTLRQSNPSSYSSVFDALGALLYTKAAANGATATTSRTWHLQNCYRGVIPGTLGAIPSSALYFGAYESMKAVLTRYTNLDTTITTRQAPDESNNFSKRLMVHALAAMSGNVLSSAVFVPKELIKQQLQYHQSGNVMGVVMDILAKKGLGGLYVGYKATLMRNIPTAVMRFSLYEEFRFRWYTQQQRNEKGNKISGKLSPKFFLAGAAAGMIASGVMTPVDVLKTRMATGTCPVDVRLCFLGVLRDEGLAGLYSGAGSRIFFSGAFSAIGFGTFEWAKGVLGLSESSQSSSSTSSSSSKLKSDKGSR